MGLLKKRKRWSFTLTISSLTFKPGSGPLVVAWERGKKTGATAPTAPGEPDAGDYYFAQETFQLPATLYNKGGSGGYEAKELVLLVGRPDAKGRLKERLAQASLDLGEIAATTSAGGEQHWRSLPLAPVGGDAPRGAPPAMLVVSITCQEAGGKGGLAAGASGLDRMPSSLSTDGDEDSAPPSRVTSFGPAAPAADRLAAVPEGRPAGAQAAARQPSAQGPALEAALSSRFDSDGLLRDSDIDEAGAPTVSGGAGVGPASSSQQQQEEETGGGEEVSAAGDVCRNLGSALERAEASAVSGAAGAGAASSVRGGAGGEATPAPAAPAAPREPPAAQQGTPGAHVLSPAPWSTGQSSISLGADPAVPFSVKPSVQRRFVRDGDGTAGMTAARRWTWRHEQPAGRLSAAQAELSKLAVPKPHDSSAASVASGGSGLASAGEHSTRAGSTASNGALSAFATAAAVAPAAPPEVSSSSLGGQRQGAGDAAPSGAGRELSLLVALSGPEPAQPLSPTPPGVLEAAARELREVAALEASVYYAGAGGREGPAPSARALQAPARRLARTVVGLGPEDGAAFGLRALAAVEAVAVGAAGGSGDLHRLCFWWANVLQLRWMFWALSQGGGGGGGGGAFDWVAAALLPALAELEGRLFEEALATAWDRLLRTVMGSGGAAEAHVPSGRSPSRGSSHGTAPGGGSRPTSPLSRASGAGRGSFEASPEEVAVQRWVGGLAAVEGALADPSRPPPAPRGPLALLRRQLLAALLRRLDSQLFARIMAPDPGPASPGWAPGGGAAGGGAGGVAVLGEGGGGALLDPGLLPFPPSAGLSFGAGVALKIAVSALAQWAADAGVREGSSASTGASLRSTDAPDYRLFPQLRATADLLMMPKQVLADPGIRREVLPGLPLRTVCTLLQRFVPDDAAPDPLPPGLLEALRSESPGSLDGSEPGTPPSEGGGWRAEEGGEEYAPPSEAALLAEGLIEAVSLTAEGESGDELEGLERRLGGGDGGAQQRFALLRELWAATG